MEVIKVSSITRVMSSEELLQVPDDGYRYELVRGELKRMVPAGSEHGVIIMKLAYLLAQCCQYERCGYRFRRRDRISE